MRILLCFLFLSMAVPSFAGDDRPVFLVFGSDAIAKGLQERLPEFAVLANTQKIPRNTEYVLMLAKAQHIFWTEQQKKAYANVLWDFDTRTAQKGAQFFVVGPLTSPNRERQRSLAIQNEWLRILCAAKRIPFIDLRQHMLDREGVWLGFLDGKHIYLPDGETVSPEGGKVLARRIHTELAKYILPRVVMQ